MLLQAVKNAAIGARESPLNNTSACMYSELIIYLIKEENISDVIQCDRERVLQ